MYCLGADPHELRAAQYTEQDTPRGGNPQWKPPFVSRKKHGPLPGDHLWRKQARKTFAGRGSSSHKSLLSGHEITGKGCLGWMANPAGNIIPFLCSKPCIYMLIRESGLISSAASMLKPTTPTDGFKARDRLNDLPRLVWSNGSGSRFQA